MEDKLLAHESKAQSFILLLGRVLIGLNFLWMGYSKIINWDIVLDYIQSYDLAYASTLLQLGIGFEIIGGLLIILGLFTRQSAAVLIFYLVVSTLLFNRFWSASEQEQFLQAVLFFKQLTIIGCLEILRTTGAGRFSLRQR